MASREAGTFVTAFPGAVALLFRVFRPFLLKPRIEFNNSMREHGTLAFFRFVFQFPLVSLIRFIGQGYVKLYNMTCQPEYQVCTLWLRHPSYVCPCLYYNFHLVPHFTVLRKTHMNPS